MAPKLINAQYIGEFQIELSFADGYKSVVDFRSHILNKHGVWQPLHDVDYFKQFRVDSDLETLVWPNGVDICPDLLYQMASGKTSWQSDTAPAA